MAFNHFSYVPSSVTNDRSGFAFKKAIPHGAQLGWLYPMCKPVKMLPGSSLKLDFAAEVRSQALIAPLMDELNFDIFAFNVPNRIVWEHWKQYLGAVDDVLFDNLSEYQVPNFKYGMSVLDADSDYLDHWDSGHENYQWNQCLACHFELPYPKKTYKDPDYPDVIVWKDYEWVKISALPFRGYNFIANEFFLPEYCSDRILFSKTDDGWSGDNMIPRLGGSYSNRWLNINTPSPSYLVSTNEVSVGGVVIPVSRAHRSLWTSCLPKPSLETLNLLGTVDTAPVGAISSTSGTTTAAVNIGLASGTVITANNLTPVGVRGSSGVSGFNDKPLVAKINEAILTVNNYRETILLQNYYDALNRAGSRYDEILATLFHVRTSMAVISIPELIVHKRFTIYRKDVVATAETLKADNSVAKPIGSQAGYIDTVVRDTFFTKSTTEHGYIHMLFCIRPAFIRMTNGFEPDWLVLNKLDEFYEQFQGMGDVPRLKMEVAYGFASGSSKTAVLGYQEYSAEYKYQRNSAVGWFDSNTPNALAGFTINDEFAEDGVSLNNFYLSCASEEVSFAKCLAIPDPTVAPQFIVDIRLNGTIYHPMKVYNIPGQGDLL